MLRQEHGKDKVTQVHKAYATSAGLTIECYSRTGNMSVHRNSTRSMCYCGVHIGPECWCDEHETKQPDKHARKRYDMASRAVVYCSSWAEYSDLYSNCSSLCKRTREKAPTIVSGSLKDLPSHQNFALCAVPASSAHDHCLFELWLAVEVPAVPRNNVLYVVLMFPDPLIVAACQISKVLYSISCKAGNTAKARVLSYCSLFLAKKNMSHTKERGVSVHHVIWCNI